MPVIRLYATSTQQFAIFTGPVAFIVICESILKPSCRDMGEHLTISFVSFRYRKSRQDRPSPDKSTNKCNRNWALHLITAFFDSILYYKQTGVKPPMHIARPQKLHGRIDLAVQSNIPVHITLLVNHQT